MDYPWYDIRYSYCVYCCLKIIVENDQHVHDLFVQTTRLKIDSALQHVPVLIMSSSPYLSKLAAHVNADGAFCKTH
jgi:hypothetical protein